MKKLLVWGGLILLLMVVGLGLIRAQQGQVGQGEQAPNFELTSFEGQTYRLSELEGKVVVVNFWASWCESCKPEARDLEEAWRMLQDRGDVVFLGVDYVDTEPEAMAYLEQFDITYPNGPDKRTEISQAFRIKGVPETYVIDREGRIAHRQIGPFQSLDDILAAIEPEL
jgi:cytochrome c biogenesis protein CcmG/thiol:disulfide interchange protein DsbE